MLNRRNFLSALLALPVVAKILPEVIPVESTLNPFEGFKEVLDDGYKLSAAEYSWQQVPGPINIDMGMGPHNIPRISKLLQYKCTKLKEQLNEEYYNVPLQ